MNTQPHIIIEKGVEYHLGELIGNQIHYDFKKMLVYLDQKGKMLFGKKFKIYEEVEVILFKLCIYFIKDYDYCTKFNIGYKTIEDYGNSNYYCFDDLGVETTGRHFGKDCNVMGEIILSRYDLFLKSKIKTHASTNLNAQELEERYGNRVRSRMRQLFNLIAFDKESVDKRK